MMYGMLYREDGDEQHPGRSTPSARRSANAGGAYRRAVCVVCIIWRVCDGFGRSIVPDADPLCMGICAFVARLSRLPFSIIGCSRLLVVPYTAFMRSQLSNFDVGPCSGFLKLFEVRFGSRAARCHGSSHGTRPHGFRPPHSTEIEP